MPDYYFPYMPGYITKPSNTTIISKFSSNYNQILAWISYELINGVLALFDTVFEALLYNSSPTMPKLHFIVNNFPGNNFVSRIT